MATPRGRRLLKKRRKLRLSLVTTTKIAGSYKTRERRVFVLKAPKRA